jgi:RHS repeat-associated protein
MKKLMLPLLPILLSAVCLFPSSLRAQTGLPAFGSFSSSNFDTVNNQDLNAFFTIPIAASAGRGMPLNLSLVYNTLVWQPGGAWTSVTDQAGNPTWGWRKDFLGGLVHFNSTTNTIKCPSTGQLVPVTFYSNYSYTDVLGTGHGFGQISGRTSAQCSDQNFGTYTSYADDHTGYYMNATFLGAPNVTSPAGSSTVEDANGNFVTKTVVSSTETDWTDSVGNTALKIFYTPNNTNPTQIQYQFLDGTGPSSYRTISLQLTALNVKTNFGCSGVVEYNGSGTLPPVNLPTELDIPTPAGGTLKYSFSYEPTPQNSGFYTGRLQRVTFPTGGYHEFDYTGANDGINCSDGTTLSMNRVVSDGVNSAAWTFVRNTSSQTTTVTVPQLADTSTASDTVYTFNSLGQETSRQVYANSPHSGNPLRTINTAWATNGTPATQVTILENGSTQSQASTTFDSNGLIGSVSEYDWGAGGHGSLLRTTNFSYQTAAAYTSRNIINLLTSKIVLDGTGTTKYRQDITYDGPALTSCPAGIRQHDDANYGCGMNVRGNPTSVTTYLTPGTPANGVTKNFTYDVFGNLLTAQLNCCQNKTWSYSSVTQYSQPDSATRGSSPTLITSATYNIYTGQVSTSTDENSQVTQYFYDFLRRPTSIVRQADNATVRYSYDDVHFTSTVTTPVDSSKSIQQVSAVDGLGRTISSTMEDGSNNIIAASINQIDLLGRPYRTSNPYTGTPSYWTSTQFDVLGRPTSVTLPDNSVSRYSYAQQTLTLTDPSGKQRASIFDSAGRLAEADEPGAGPPATPATGSVSISGAEQSAGGAPATGSAGSVSINGSEKSTQTGPPTSGRGSVTISGSERTTLVNTCPPRLCKTTYYDNGSVSITINGIKSSVLYNQSSTSSGIATALANAINANTGINSLVSASVSSSTVNIVARQSGSQTNYSLSASSATSLTQYFSGTSFPAAASGSTLTGGNDTQFTYDSGTVTVTISGTPMAVSYDGSSTNASIASQLASALTAGSLVNASANGNVISLSSKTTGAATNYSLSTSSQSSNSSLFNPPSFTGSPSGSVMTGGSDGTATIFDSGTAWITVGGATATVNYSQGSTPSSVASALAAALTGSTVSATASNSTVNLTSIATGSAANLPLSAGSSTSQPGSFSQPSFQAAPSGTALTGGTDAAPLSLSTPAITTYRYTVLDSLTSVTQGSQTRTYLYDALGRLQSATTPEAGTVCFGTLSGSTCQANGYDSFDNLLYRTDARGVQTNYNYDGLNRLHQIAYTVGSTGVPATPTVTFAYGTSPAQFNNGRLITMTDGAGAETYTYNNLGHLTQLQKVISGVTYTIGYSFNIAGEVTQLTYPSGRVVQQSFDAVGRLCEIASVTTGCGNASSPYATAFTYNNASQVTAFSYGNGIATTIGYSPDRLQLTSIKYVKSTTTLLNLTYAYGSAGVNNGQISGITDAVDNGRSVSYGYDPLARLSTAVTTGSANYPQWGLSMSYDRYGNRAAQTVTAGTGPSNPVGMDVSTNHIVGLGYDANGNITNDGSNTLVYDAENRTISTTSSSSSGTYTYDGSSLRIKKVAGGTTTVYVFSGSKVIAEYENGASPATPSREYVYSGSALLAKIDPTGTKYYHQDQLSDRLVTDSSGNLVAQVGHFPFGESWYNASNDKLIFTTYERDSESGNDYALARNYVNRVGRFSSPDSMSGSIGDPQSLNRYSYVTDDPIDLSDPEGLCPNAGPLVVNGNVICTSARPKDGGDIIGGAVLYDFSGFNPADWDLGTPAFWDLLTITFMPLYGPGSIQDAYNLGGIHKPAPPPGYKQCVEEALQEVIANTEGTAKDPNNGYGTNVRGTITNAPPAFAALIGKQNVIIMDPEQLPGHPNLYVGARNSTAFGRYQITHKTAANYGFTDFSPRGQDAAAEFLMDNVRQMVVPAMNGNIMGALIKGNTEWTSLPGGTEENHRVDPVSIFNRALRTLPDCL